MGRYLVLAFIVVPILEIAVFIQAGELIGLWPTLGGIVLTAVVGVALLRWQGLKTLQRAQANLAEGTVPLSPMAEGLALVVAGALLLTPGFVTDAVGFLLLVPAVRQRIGAYLIKHMTFMTSGMSGMTGFGPPPGDGKDGSDTTIDTEYEDLTDQTPNPDTPWKKR